MDLIDGSDIETYRFGAEGLVSTEYGKRGGAVAGPLFYWRVEGGALIISERPTDHEVERLTEPRINGEVVSAKRKTGRSAQYRLKSGA